MLFKRLNGKSQLKEGMYKKNMCLISAILLLGMVGSALAVVPNVNWTNGGGDCRVYRQYNQYRPGADADKYCQCDQYRESEGAINFH